MYMCVCIYINLALVKVFDSLSHVKMTETYYVQTQGLQYFQIKKV